jgi:hypothetical protein
MSAGIPLGQEIPGLRGLNNNNAMTQSMPSAGTPGGNNNIGQVYQDMGQNYQQFGQAYQQATQAADQLKNSYSVNQQQMNQYLTALQGALGGMSTANMNTGGNNPGFDPGPGIGITAPGGRPFLEQLADPGFGTPGTNTTPGMAFGTAVFSPQQQQMISAQNQRISGSLSPTYNNAVGGAQDIYNQGQQGLGGTGQQALQTGINTMSGAQDLYNQGQSNIPFNGFAMMTPDGSSIVSYDMQGNPTYSSGNQPTLNTNAQNGFFQTSIVPQDLYNRYASVAFQG